MRQYCDLVGRVWYSLYKLNCGINPLSIAAVSFCEHVMLE